MQNIAMRLERLATMREFGFGPDVMKKNKVCQVCGCSCDTQETHCKDCGANLPCETLFDLYKAWHLYCPACDTVVASTATFCPECGKLLRPRRIGFWRCHKKAGEKDG